jgi:hypothetical protein
MKHGTSPKTLESSHTRPSSSADVHPSPFAAHHRATMAAIRAELAAEFGDDFSASFTPEEQADAERAFDEANRQASAEAFAIGVAAAALKAERPAVRDDLPALVVLERLEREHQRALAQRDARIAELETENRALRTQSAA